MVTTFYLIRHGETEGAEVRRYKGSIDVPLSENGIKQIKKVALFIKEHLKVQSSAKYLSYLREIHKTKGSRGQGVKGSREAQRLAAVYTSNLSRAVKSAEIIAEPYKLKPVQVKDLRERSFGIWEGMTFTEIKEKYPKEFNLWVKNPLKYSPIKGESTVEVEKRVMKALKKILGSHKGNDIAIVSHGGVNRIILCNILGIPLENIFRIEQDYAAVNIVELWDKYPVVKLINGVIELAT